VNFSGKVFKAVQYGLDPVTARIDYEQVRRLAQEHRPKLIIAGFSAYSRHLDYEKFRAIADEVGRIFTSTWRTWRDWWRRGCIRTRCPMRTW